MFIDEKGKCTWSLYLPQDIPNQYSVQDIAVFSKGYLKDYPVFLRNTNKGILVLGYPKDSFMKIISNYFPISAIKMFPFFLMIVLLADTSFLFYIFPL